MNTFNTPDSSHNIMDLFIYFITVNSIWSCFKNNKLQWIVNIRWQKTAVGTSRALNDEPPSYITDRCKMFQRESYIEVQSWKLFRVMSRKLSVEELDQNWNKRKLY